MKKFYYPIIILVILILGLLIFSLYPKTILNKEVSGVQFNSQIWANKIIISEDVLFLPWTTLTIKPGTKILFNKKQDIENTKWTKYADDFIIKHNDPTGKEGYQKSHFDIYAKINAIGTKENPIIFTSNQEDQEYADWDQLVLASNSHLEYVEISYTHNGLNLDGNNIIIKNSKIHDSLWSCIDIFSKNNLIENNEIYHCWHQAIGIKTQGQNLIQNNNIHDAQLSINCENQANPIIKENNIKAAPITPECSNLINNKEVKEKPEVKGGTYNKKLIYPSNE